MHAHSTDTVLYLLSLLPQPLLIASGASGFVLSAFVGNRPSFRDFEDDVHHSTPTALVGSVMVWFGWVGLMLGAALSADEEGEQATISAHISSAASLAAWMVLEQRELGYMTSSCITHGTIVGVVAVLASGPYVAPAGSIIMGAIASVATYYGRRLTKHPRLRVDDTFEAFGFYFFAGMTSLLLTGVFAYYFGPDGMVKGDALQPWRQFIAMVAVTLYSGGTTFILAVAISIFMRIRTTSEEEEEGVDIALHQQSIMYDKYGENLHEAELGSFANYWWDDWLYIWSVLVALSGVVVAVALAVLASIVVCCESCTTAIKSCLTSGCGFFYRSIWSVEEKRRQAAVRVGLRQGQPTLPDASESDSDGEDYGGDSDEDF